MERKRSYQLLDKKSLNKSYIRWMMYNLVATSFEFLEAFGFALSMEPIAKRLYKKLNAFSAWLFVLPSHPKD